MTDTSSSVVEIAIRLSAYLSHAGEKPDGERVDGFLVDMLNARSERATDALALLAYATQALAMAAAHLNDADSSDAEETRRLVEGSLALVLHAQRGLEAETGIAAEDFIGRPVTKH